MKSNIQNDQGAGVSRLLSATMIVGLALFALLSGTVSLGLALYLVISLTEVVGSSSYWWVSSLGIWVIVFIGYLSGLCVKVFYTEVVFPRIRPVNQVSGFQPDFTKYCLFTMQLVFVVTPFMLVLLLVYSPLSVIIEKESLTTFPWTALAETVTYMLVLWGVVITWAHNWVVKTVESSP